MVTVRCRGTKGMMPLLMHRNLKREVYAALQVRNVLWPVVMAMVLYRNCCKTSCKVRTMQSQI